MNSRTWLKVEMSSAIILCGGEYMGIILQSHKQVIIASQRFSLASAIDSD